jgi:hypothetical protein
MKAATTTAATTAATTTTNNQQHPALNGRHSFHLTSGRSKKNEKQRQLR